MSTTIKSFFDRQNRDLSDKSNEDDERKKEREKERERAVQIHHLVKMTQIFLKKEQNPHVVLTFYIAAYKIWKKR